MKTFATLLLLFATALPVFAQSDIPYNPVEPADQLSLYRDSEEWIHQRYRWFRDGREEADGTIPEGARMEAWRQTQKMSVYRPAVSLSKKNGTAAAAWQLVGPSNIGGRLTGVAIHPTDSSIVYFTAADGGIWKSTNATADVPHFYPVADDLPTMAMGSIDIDPSNPDIIYVGTGEANGSADSYPGVGVVKSTDAGATWDVISNNFAKNIGCIRVHHSIDSIVFVAARQGLFRSTDGGVSWEKTRGGVAHDLVLHPTSDSLIYAAVQNAGILRSIDTGRTWEVLDMGVGTDSIGRCAVDLCRSQPEIIYALLTGSKDPYKNKTLAVMKSTDGGESWERTMPADNPRNFFNTYGWYNCEIAVHPMNPNMLLAGGVGLYLSLDGGRNFSPRGGLHVDQHAIEFSPSSPDICFVGNDGGLYVSDNGGITYRSRNDDIAITQFYELGISLPNPGDMMGGTQDNGSNHGSDTAHANWEHQTGGDGGYCVFDYEDPNIKYAEYQNGSHLRTVNGGKNWTGINDGLYGKGRWVTPVEIHPTDPSILFTATTKQLYKTTNRGLLWVPFHGDMDSSKSITYIAVSPLNPDIMYVGNTNGQIYRTTDAGSHWDLKAEGLPSGRNTNDIVFHPTDPNTVYACFSHYIDESVFKTTDAGETWESISGNLPAIPTNALAINYGMPNELFVGTDFGVYATTDGGENWEILGDGMPKVVVVDLELHPTTGKLYAATHGRSVYSLGVTLGVELLNLSARRDGSNVRLDWRTSHESNNRGFAVERRTRFGGWEEIAFVDGKGSSAGLQLYSHVDNALPAGDLLYYRLKQVDTDGSETYSNEIPVEIRDAVASDFTLEQNYPNPFNPVTTIRYTLPHTGAVQLKITDALGNTVSTLVDRQQHAGTHHVFFDATAIPSGAYFYHLTYGNTRVTKKMMVLK
ncbi:T9SS type A sorting domain-containing protein [bacterium]|nr:T9SS type A sorting domain-containing protein [bacterium]